MSRAINQALKNLEGVGEQKANFAYRWAGNKLFKEVIEISPVDTGRFRANWFITTGSPSNKTTNSTAEKGDAYVDSEFPKKPLKVKKIFLTNNLPYAETLEYGLYPNPPKVRTKKTAGGYSTQAPTGMVRHNSKKFGRWIKRGLSLAK